MSEMVERVARAICAEEYGSEDAGWENQIPAARAAMAALRTPSAAMLNAGRHTNAADLELGIWQAMIDAALRDA